MIDYESDRIRDNERRAYWAAVKEGQRKAALIAALRAWVAQSPRLDPREYSDRASYDSDRRKVTRALKHCTELIDWAERTDITHDAIAATMPRNERLTWDGERLDYTTGQYWPVEYRRAVAVALSRAAWAYARERCGCETGDDVRAWVKRNFSAGVADILCR